MDGSFVVAHWFWERCCSATNSLSIKNGPTQACIHKIYMNVHANVVPSMYSLSHTVCIIYSVALGRHRSSASFGLCKWEIPGCQI